MFNDRGRSLLAVGGSLSAALSVLHVVVIVMGPSGYRYFGAPEEFARMTEAGSIAPAVLTGLFAVIFAIWAVYGFAGARLIPRPPLVRLGLVVIATVYILRGLSALPEALLLARGEPITVYCVLGPRAWMVGGVLRLRGRRDVRMLAGHMRRWKKDRKPLE